MNGEASEGRYMTSGKRKTKQTSKQEGGAMLIVDKVELKTKITLQSTIM